MMRLGIAGAGAFGTALAVALARSGPRLVLWARDPAQAAAMKDSRRNARHLAEVEIPETVTITADFALIAQCDAVLLAMPMQALGDFLDDHAARLDGRALVSCAKGIDLRRRAGAGALIAAACPASAAAVLTGPSFAADIARGLPTALTLACADETMGEALQHRLATPVLRLYRSPDVVGAELGGALKNVIAIAAGIVIGARLGESARAALMTRGYAEMTRFATRLGARPETLAGLSGFGDLVLTCASTQSRNFRYGEALGRGAGFDPAVTVEGVATARAVAAMAETLAVDMPIAAMVAAVIERRVTVAQAVEALLSRPLKQE